MTETGNVCRGVGACPINTPEAACQSHEKLLYFILSYIPVRKMGVCLPDGGIESEENAMRMRTRLFSLLLTGALLVPVFPAAQAAETEGSGTLSATLRIDLPQSLDALEDRNIRVELLRDGRSLGDLPLAREDGDAELGGYPAVVAPRNRDGGELGGGDWPGYLDLTVSGLPKGSYCLSFTGEGYVPFSQRVSLEEYARHVTLGTGDATFTLGDVNGDGRINERDREALSAALGSTDRRDLRQYDLSGDGVVDIYDLACVSRGQRAQGDAEIRDTTLLSPPVDSAALWDALVQKGVSVTGSLEDLFRDNGRTVTFSAEEGPLVLTLPLSEPVEMEELQIVSPEGPGAMEAGTVTMTLDDGGEETIPFDLSLPQDVHAIGPLPGSSVVSIPLGRRVAVKEITITVTRTQDGEYAVVESIRFLKEIVPENPAPPNSEIRNLSAVPGDERVSLRWRELPNVSGYRVDYRLQDGGAWKSLQTDRPWAEITGLDNLKTYLFTVTPVDGAWEGRTSNAVSAVPQPARAPDAPDMVSVSPLDGALSVSWKAAKNATYYELWYQAENESEARVWGGRLNGTGAVITDLTNGVTYSITVTAGNAAGVSGPSRTALGTPNAVDYSRPEGIPTQGVLDWKVIDRVWLADASNVSPSAYSAQRPFRSENMADGDFSTHWTSHSYGDGNWWDSKQVLCTFNRPVDLASVIWVPRLDGGYASNLRVYTVSVWREGDNLNGPGTPVAPLPEQGGNAGDVNTWLPVQNDPTATKFAVLPFQPVTDVVKIAVTIEQRAYTAVSLSELMFLEYDPARCLPENIADLFASELCTALKPGVSQADVDALRQRLNSDERNYYLNPGALADELDLAEELLQGGSRGVLVSGLQSRSGAADGKKYGQGGSDLQPLGAAAKAGEEITIYADGIPAGESVTVYATQFNAEASAWRAQAGTLRNGRNILTVPKIGSQNTPRGGSLYVTYGGSSPEAIRLHVRRAADIPVLELSGWYVMCDRARLSLPSVLLSLPAAAVLNSLGPDRTAQVETLYADILAWEDLMHICKTTQGIDRTYARNDMTSRQNIRCMQMFSGAFMYAAGSHIGIGYGSCGSMACGKPLRFRQSALRLGHRSRNRPQHGQAGQGGDHQQYLFPHGPDRRHRRVHPAFPAGAERKVPRRLHQDRPGPSRGLQRRVRPAGTLLAASSGLRRRGQAHGLLQPLLQSLEGRELFRRRNGLCGPFGPHRLRCGEQGPDGLLHPLGHDPQRGDPGRPEELSRGGPGPLVSQRPEPPGAAGGRETRLREPDAVCGPHGGQRDHPHPRAQAHREHPGL